MLCVFILLLWLIPSNSFISLKNSRKALKQSKLTKPSKLTTSIDDMDIHKQLNHIKSTIDNELLQESSEASDDVSGSVDIDDVYQELNEIFNLLQYNNNDDNNDNINDYNDYDYHNSNSS